MGRKRNIIENRKRQLLTLSQKALKLNRETEARIDAYKKKGYTIENENYIRDTYSRILKILSKSRPTATDVQMMKEFASASQYDYVKVDSKRYMDIRKSGRREAKKINKALQTAVEIYPVRNEYYTKYLEPMMADLVDNQKYIPKAGDENEYFKISPNYTGKRAELYKFVEFKQLPTDNEEIMQYSEEILDLDWSSYANYEKKMEDINHSRYMKNLGITDEKKLTKTMIAMEQLMNSSAAWRIASKNVEDSAQAKANWQMLYNAVEEMTDAGDRGLIDTVLTMIDNEEDLDIILNEIDTGITNMIRRR